HSSGPPVAWRLERPTREQREPRYRSPIWSCSGWGLACRPCYHVRGGLLPRRFTIAVLIAEAWADCSLCHFPSLHSVRQLTGILLCGARTFLCANKCAAIARPASMTIIAHRTREVPYSCTPGALSGVRLLDLAWGSSIDKAAGDRGAGA